MRRSANVSSLQRRLRRVATDAFAPTAFGSGPGRNSRNAPPAVDPKQQAISAAATNLLEYIQRTLASTNFIEVPVRTMMRQTAAAAKKVGDPSIEQKVTLKFKRIFGEMFSALDLIRSNLDPLVSVLTAVVDGKALDSRGAKNIIDAVSAALPLVRSGFKSLGPRNHESALEAEIQKQGHFLTQIKKVMSSTGTENPETQAKLQTAVQEAELYLEGLRTLAGPDFADRIQSNVERSLTQHIPALIQAAKAFAKEFGAVEKAASVRQSQKRLRIAAKRIVLLAYLTSKSL